MGRTAQGTVGVPSNAKQQASILRNAEISGAVRSDDTTSAEKRGECFAPSVATRILDKHPGFGETKNPEHSHTKNKGLLTLDSDSTKQPLTGSDTKIELDQMRNYQNSGNGGTPLVTDGKTTSYLK